METKATFAWALGAIAATFWACGGDRISMPADHPGHADAATAAPSAFPTTLDADYDPFAGIEVEPGGGHHHHSHGHGEPSQPPLHEHEMMPSAPQGAQ